MNILMYVGTSLLDHPVTSCNDAACAGAAISANAVARSNVTPHLRAAVHRARGLFRREGISGSILVASVHFRSVVCEPLPSRNPLTDRTPAARCNRSDSAGGTFASY